MHGRRRIGGVRGLQLLRNVESGLEYRNPLGEVQPVGRWLVARGGHTQSCSQSRLRMRAAARGCTGLHGPAALPSPATYLAPVRDLHSPQPTPRAPHPVPNNNQRREIALHASLAHQNVVTMYAAFQASGALAGGA